MFGEINHPTMGKGTPMALGKPLWATLRMVDLRSVQHFATMWLQYIYIHIYINIYIYIFIYIILMDLVISKQYLKVICWINELIQDEKNCRTPGDPTNFSFVPESSYSQDGQCTWQGSLPSKLLKIVSEGDSDLYQLGVLGGVMALMGLNVTTWYSMEVS
jgi:hypothetical protein